MTVSEMVVVTESQSRWSCLEKLVVAETAGLALVVAVAVGPVAVTVSEMVVVTESQSRWSCLRSSLSLKLLDLHSWWLLQ